MSKSLRKFKYDADSLERCRAVQHQVGDANPREVSNKTESRACRLAIEN